ncbi:VanZ family protein [Diaminobutyricibacter tongyongensis]|uniref:VanZ family protein n=1 Tax=Leifsonia tongyongensis TaxID=1268043 RepID=A0A6L9Y1D4_9MICO|nr:VanZ family protein [Diaminobutyricibacter tongyongensis]
MPARSSILHGVLVALTVGYIAFVGWVTLTPQPAAPDPNSFVQQLIRLILGSAAFHWLGYAGLEFTANIGMFIPVGVLLALLLPPRRLWVAVLIGFAMTVTIETAQLFIPGRFSDIRDIIANTAGAALGVAMVSLVRAASAPRSAVGEPRE